MCGGMLHCRASSTVDQILGAHPRQISPQTDPERSPSGHPRWFGPRNTCSSIPHPHSVKGQEHVRKVWRELLVRECVHKASCSLQEESETESRKEKETRTKIFRALENERKFSEGKMRAFGCILGGSVWKLWVLLFLRVFTNSGG